MKYQLPALRNRIKQLWINFFWENPNKLMGLKVAISIAAVLIPLKAFGHAAWGGIMALGILAGAIAETDDHPKGRMKSLGITWISFLIATSSVELLRPYPLFFGIGLFISAFTFIFIGGMGERYRGVSFATLLVSIYAMLGTSYNLDWYIQPLLLTAGAACYGIISLILLVKKPWRPLQEQLSMGFKQLSKYLEIKSKFFPSEESEQVVLRNKLAQKNTDVVQSLEAINSVFRNYNYILKGKNSELGKYSHYFLLLQQLHERATSSHQSYDILSHNTKNREIIHGIGLLMQETSHAMELFATSMLTEKKFRVPLKLVWTLNMVNTLVNSNKSEQESLAISLLYNNLKEMVGIMEKLASDDTTTVVMEYEEPSFKQRLMSLMNYHHPRFKYALRLSICFIIGYALVYYLKWDKGEWIILTSLFVMQQNYVGTRQKLNERVGGTIMGLLLGIVLIKLLPTVPGNILIVLFSVYLFFYYVKQDYSKAVVFVTTTVIALFNIQFNQGFNIIVPRLVDTIIGAILALLSVKLILPEKQNLRNLLANALQNNRKYLEAIYLHNLNNEEYISVRREANVADMALTNGWRSVRVENDSKKTKEEQAFRLTYLNHSMLSYLSAFGAFYKDKNVDEYYLEACKIVAEKIETAKRQIESGINVIGDDYKILTSQCEILEIEADSSCPTKTTLLLNNIEHLANEMLAETFRMNVSYK